MTNPAYSNKNKKRAIPLTNLKKRVLIGDSHEIDLTFDEISNNSYKSTV